MRLRSWTTFDLHRATGWKLSRGIDRGSIQCGSTISGASASSGPKQARNTLKSLIIIKSSLPSGRIHKEAMQEMLKILAPVHPGEILREEYLKPLAISAGALARKLHVPRTRI